MKVRALATMLWFIAGWSAAGFFTALSGMPQAVAVVGGLAVAMFVWFDPSGRLWGRAPQQRRIRPADEVAAELDEQAARGSREAAEQRLG